MKFDQPRGFRKSMSWVHTWGGLLAGWLLFAIFVTGTLSFFRQEITVWMQPELHSAKADSQGLARALRYLEDTAPDAKRWSIEQPNPRSPVLGLSASNSERDRRGSQIMMDPATGQILKPRETAGGRFFVTFHYQLHGMGPSVGRWIVGIVTMAMFVALITGVIVHRNVFKDFFTFRPGKGKRSWLDAHNATGILALPFYLVITFSGLLLLGAMLLPSINWAAYNGDSRGLHAEIRGMAPGTQRGSEDRGGDGRGTETRMGEQMSASAPATQVASTSLALVAPSRNPQAASASREAWRKRASDVAGERSKFAPHHGPRADGDGVGAQSGDHPARGGDEAQSTERPVRAKGGEDAGAHRQAWRNRASGVAGERGEFGSHHGREDGDGADTPSGDRPARAEGGEDAEAHRQAWRNRASSAGFNRGGERAARDGGEALSESYSGWHRRAAASVPPSREGRMQARAVAESGGNLDSSQVSTVVATEAVRALRVPLTDLPALLVQARERWPVNGVQGITITNPGKADAVIEIREVGGERLSNRGQPERLRFNGVTGQLLETPENRYSVVRSIYATFQALHLGTFALPFARWLLFASGILGCVVIASGLVIWVISRQKDVAALGRKPVGHRLVEVLNVPAVAGVLVALMAYFWANRLIPAVLEGRSDWEIRSFLIVWGLTLIHSALRSHKRAWVEQLSLAGALSLLLPLLNALTGGIPLYKSFGLGQWQVASFDLCALVFGVVLIWTAQKVCFHVPRVQRASRKEDEE